LALRLGASGLLPASLDAVTSFAARRLQSMGFVGVGVHFTAQDPFTIGEAECWRARDVLRDAGIAIAQSTGYAHYTLPLIHPDREVRGRALKTLREGLRIGAALGAASVLSGAGSLSDRGAYAPHLDNFTQRSFDLLVDTLRQAASVAEGYGVPISVEGHLLTTVNSPERMVALLDAVDSPYVQATCDPVNYVGSVAEHYDTPGLLRRLIPPLGGRLACSHAKDTVLRDQLTLHLDEGAPGEGNLDYATFLQLLDINAPDSCVIVEHMPLERVLRGAAYIRQVAAQAGVTLITQ
jgi:sugar phosphate isomerase/epimerase